MDSQPAHRQNLPHPEAQAQSIEETAGKWWVLVAIGAGTFMSALDGSVVNTTLPLISRSFTSTIAQVEWIITIYLLVLSGLLLSFGRLGDLQGHKRVYIAGFAIFLVSSALCGLASSVNLLILYRGLQALGAAMLMANSPAILTKSFPARQRGQALGLQATMTYLGLTVGPSLGGWLADQFSWRAVFYINVPVGLIALALSVRFIQADHPSNVSERFDPLGAFAFMAGLVVLLFGLNQGHAQGWTSPVILGALGVSAVLLIWFVRIESRAQSPMLDLQLFRNWGFSGAVISAVLNYTCLYTITFLMPFYLLQGRSFTPTQAGLILTAMPIAMAIVAPISGTLSDRIGTRVLTMIGMAGLALGLYLLSGLGPDTPPAQIALRLSVVGIGVGVFVSPNTSALMGAAPRSRQGIAAGIMATSRNVGMVLGVGLAGAVFMTILSQAGETQSAALFQALQISFLVSSGIAILGLGVSAIRQGK
jgi:EmrB/QacA subfamily drug resistance transporter